MQNRAPDLFNFIENFSFDWGEYVTLLEMFNNDTTDYEEDDEEERCKGWHVLGSTTKLRSQ